MLKITLFKSTISETPRNRATVQALGLRKTNRSVVQEDNAVIRGMIHHVKHLVKVEEVEGSEKTPKRQGKKAIGRATKPAAKPASKKAEAPEGAAPSAPEGAALSAPAESPPKKAPAKKATTKKDS